MFASDAQLHRSELILEFSAASMLAICFHHCRRCNEESSPRSEATEASAATTSCLSSGSGDLLQTKLNPTPVSTDMRPRTSRSQTSPVNRSLLTDFSYFPFAAEKSCGSDPDHQASRDWSAPGSCHSRGGWTNSGPSHNISGDFHRWLFLKVITK